MSLACSSVSNEGWLAQLDLAFEKTPERTVLRYSRHQGPLRVQRPFYPETPDVCHLYLIHPPGGVVGGDRLEISLHLHQDSSALITTPGSTKFYYSAGDWAQVVQRLYLDKHSVLEWFPHEAILFPGALLHARTEVHLEPGAVFMGWDLICLGRPSNKESFEKGKLDSRFSLYREGKALLRETQRVQGIDELNELAGLRGFPLMGSFMAVGCGEAHLEAIQPLLQPFDNNLPMGATLIDDLLIVRVLGSQTEQVQNALIPIWHALRKSVLEREPVMPRIWAT